VKNYVKKFEKLQLLEYTIGLWYCVFNVQWKLTDSQLRLSHGTNKKVEEKKSKNKCVSRTDTNPPFGPMDLTGGWGTSADIVPTRIKFGVDPSTRCWDIAQKPLKCKNSPFTFIVTKILFPPFSARWGPLTPKRGEDTPGTRLRPHAKIC